MTWTDLEKSVHLLGNDERYGISLGCGDHREHVARFPIVMKEPEVTPLRYCPNCLTTFTMDGVALNLPQTPSNGD